MSDKIQLTLFMPDLLIAAEAQRLPALATLLGKADKTALPILTVEQQLATLFDLPIATQLPVAALTALADGLPVNVNEWWLRADPAVLEADQATVYLMAAEPIDLT